jgi:hypothetical protein
LVDERFFFFRLDFLDEASPRLDVPEADLTISVFVPD